MIEGSSECRKGPTTLYSVIEIVVVFTVNYGCRTVWREPGLAGYRFR